MINSYYFSDGDIQLSPHFMLHEFQSHNGCDEVLIDDALIRKGIQGERCFKCHCK